MSEQRTPHPEQAEPEQAATEVESGMAAGAQAGAAPGEAAPVEGEPAEPRSDDAQERIAEVEDAWRRTAAELDNLRKRTARDIDRARTQERARVAELWLPMLDNLDRALAHASSDPEPVIEGVRAVQRQALAVLAQLGFPRREDQGRPFDPSVHEAVGTVSGDELTPGTVAEVVRPGYGPDDAVLRPASVVVATRGE